MVVVGSASWVLPQLSLEKLGTKVWSPAHVLTHNREAGAGYMVRDYVLVKLRLTRQLPSLVRLLFLCSPEKPLCPTPRACFSRPLENLSPQYPSNQWPLLELPRASFCCFQSGNSTNRCRQRTVKMSFKNNAVLGIFCKSHFFALECFSNPPSLSLSSVSSLSPPPPGSPFPAQQVLVTRN